MPYSLVKELPDCLQRALTEVGYGRQSIELRPKEKESLFIAGGDGYRGFVILVDLASGQYKIHQGSWGGSNPWSSSPVDLDNQSYDLPLNGAVIKGSVGGTTPVYATITLHPNNIVKYLTTGISLTDDEQRVLYAYKTYTSAFRKGHLIGKEKVIADLAQRKLIKISKNGASQITVEGRNALEMSGYKGY